MNAVRGAGQVARYSARSNMHILAHKRIESEDSLDDYPTPPWATRALLEHLGPDKDRCSQTVWEPGANRGHMVQVLEEHFGTVLATDIADYGAGFPVRDFLEERADDAPVDWIITNPPYTRAMDFAIRALPLARKGVALLCRLSWLEGKERYNTLFTRTPPTEVAVFSARVRMDEGRLVRKGGSVLTFAWFLWRKKDMTGPRWDTKTRWIPYCARERLDRKEDYPVDDTMIEVAFGALVPPLHEQLNVPEETVALEQRLAEAITLLAVQGMLTGKERENARKRLTKRIGRTLREQGKS